MKSTATAARAAKLTLGALVAVVVGTTSARADDCATVGGSIVGGVCQVSTSSALVSGSLSFDESLVLLTGGIVNVAPAGATIVINSGDLLINNGAAINGGTNDTCGGGNPPGAPIAIQVNGNINTSVGSVIRSNGCSGGAISLTTLGRGRIDLAGLVESAGGQSGTGAVQGPGGGPIAVKAGCALTLEAGGRVSSRGRDPGADLIHFEGCDITILGRVESVGGKGDATPNHPANHCGLPGKPEGSTACVQIWSGGSVLIDSTGTNGGEISADLFLTGGSLPRSWIEIFAAGAITINDGPGNVHTVTIPGGGTAESAFAVHANVWGGTNGHGGLINISSTTANVTASGNVAQASTPGAGVSTNAGGSGGEIHIESNTALTLDGATIVAQGDTNGSGGFGDGGQLGTTTAPIRAFNGPLSWVGGTGDAQPTGSPLAGGTTGAVNLRGCGTVTVTATFPATRGSFPVSPTNVCGGVPTLPSYVALPSNCNQLCNLPTGGIAGTKWNDQNDNHVRDQGEPGLASWEIRLFTPGSTTPITSTFTALVDGTYAFAALADGTYEVCEALVTGWTQTFPTTGVNCQSRGGGLGYTVTIAGGQVVNGIDFGNHLPPPSNGIKRGRKWNDLNGNGVLDEGEPGLSGWQIQLYRFSDRSLLAQAITDDNGNYQFTGLAPDTYVVCEVLQTGWRQTAPSVPLGIPPVGDVVVDCALNTSTGTGIGYGFVIQTGTEDFEGNDFGNELIPPVGQITGVKWNDIDGNGQRDLDEPGLPNWQIHLFPSGSTQELTNVLTGPLGVYTFSNLAPGDYDVCETITPGWTQTFPHVLRTAGLDCASRTGGFGYTVTVTAGGVAAAVDFGNHLPTPASNGVKSGSKWNDLNGDGIRGVGEPALPDWDIHLFKVGDPNFDRLATTDGNGNYSFTGLDPGAYVACETPQAGWIQTAPNTVQQPPASEAVVDCANLPGVVASGLGYAFTIVQGNEVFSGNDFGNQQRSAPAPGQIAGTKWDDLNGNGTREQAEQGLGGWQISIFTAGSSQPLAQTFTADDGSYAFLNLPAGVYQVCESATPGWAETLPLNGSACPFGFGYTVTISPGQVVNAIDFGNHLEDPETSGVKTGTKFNDLNGNGVRDTGEPGLPSWQIHLFSASDPNFHRQVTTDANGAYSFNGLGAGTYIACEAPQGGWIQTAPGAQTPASGEQIVDCSSHPGVAGRGYQFTITTGETFSGNDFGNKQQVTPGTGQISGVKWSDLNGNGARQSSEPGLSSWAIHLFSASDASFHQEVSTDSGGAYTFTGLAPGSYLVCEGPRSGWVQTAPNGGTQPPGGASLGNCAGHAGLSGLGYSVTIGAGTIVQGVDFGNQQVAAIPTLSEWGTLALMLLLAGWGYASLRRRTTAPKRDLS